MYTASLQVCPITLIAVLSGCKRSPAAIIVLNPGSRCQGPDMKVLCTFIHRKPEEIDTVLSGILSWSPAPAIHSCGPRARMSPRTSIRFQIPRYEDKKDVGLPIDRQYARRGSLNASESQVTPKDGCGSPRGCERNTGYTGFFPEPVLM